MRVHAKKQQRSDTSKFASKQRELPLKSMLRHLLSLGMSIIFIIYVNFYSKIQQKNGTCVYTSRKQHNKPENSTDSVHAFSQLCLHVANVLHDKFAHISKMTLLKASLKSIIRYCINISNIGFVNILFGGGSCSDIQWQYLRPLHPRPWPKSQLSIKDRIKIIHINHIQKICCIKKINI